jgi:hypothetical protein
MCGGDKIEVDVVRLELVQHQWVKKNIEPHRQFDAGKEKEIFKEARQIFLKKYVASTSTA